VEQGLTVCRPAAATGSPRGGPGRDRGEQRGAQRGAYLLSGVDQGAGDAAVGACPQGGGAGPGHHDRGAARSQEQHHRDHRGIACRGIDDSEPAECGSCRQQTEDEGRAGRDAGGPGCAEKVGDDQGASPKR